MKEKLKKACQSFLSSLTRGRKRALSAFLAVCLLFESFPLVLSLADSSVTIESDMGNGIGILNIDGVNIAYTQSLVSDGGGHFTLSLNMSATTTLKDNSVNKDVAKYGYFVASQDGTYLFELWGGNGANGGDTQYGKGGQGGQGGYVYASMELFAGDIIYYTIGGNGETTITEVGGGANGGAGHGDNGNQQIGAGGGYSAIYYFSKASGDAETFMSNYCDENGRATLSDALPEDRVDKYIMIAGGGGGGGAGNSFSLLTRQRRTANGGSGGSMNSVSGQLVGTGYDVEGTFYCGGNGVSSGDEDNYIGHGGSNVPGKAPTSIAGWSDASPANNWLGTVTSDTAPGYGGDGNLRGGAGGAGYCGGSGGVMTGILSGTNVGGGGGGSSFISSKMSEVPPTLASYLSMSNESSTGGSVKVTYMVDKVEYLQNLILDAAPSKYFTIADASCSTGITSVIDNKVNISNIALGVPSLGTPGVADFDVTIGFQIMDNFGGGNDVPLVDSFTIMAPEAIDTSAHDLGLSDACSYVNLPWSFAVKTQNYVATETPYTLPTASLLYVDTVSSIDLGAMEYDFIDAISAYSVTDEGGTSYPIDEPVTVSENTKFTVGFTVTPTPSQGKAVVGDVLIERTFTRTAKIMVSAGGEGALGAVFVTYVKTTTYDESTGKYTLTLNQKYKADVTAPVAPEAVMFQYGDPTTSYEVTLDGYYYIQVWGGNGGAGGIGSMGEGSNSRGTGGTGGYVGTWVHLLEGDVLDITCGANGTKGQNASDVFSTGRQGSGGGATVVKLNSADLVGAGGGGGGGGYGAASLALEAKYKDGGSVDNASFGSNATAGSPANITTENVLGGSAGANMKNGIHCEVVFEDVAMAADVSGFSVNDYTERASVGGACAITCIQPDVYDGYDVICDFNLNAQISSYFDVESVTATGATIDGTNTHTDGKVILTKINPTDLTYVAKDETTDTWSGESNISIVCTPKTGFLGGNDVPLLDPGDTVFTNAMQISQGSGVSGTIDVDRSDLSDCVNVPLSGNTAQESDITVTDCIYVIGSGVSVPVSALVSFSGTLPEPSWASDFVQIVSPEDSADFGGASDVSPSEATVYTVEAGLKPLGEAEKAVVPASVLDLTVTKTVRVDVEVLVDTSGLSHLSVEDEVKTRNEFATPEDMVTAIPGDDYATTLVPDDGWELPETIKVTVDGVEIDDFDYDNATGELVIPAADLTGKIGFDASAKEKTYTLTYTAQLKNPLEDAPSSLLSVDYKVEVKAGVSGKDFEDILKALIAKHDPATAPAVTGYTYEIEYPTEDGSPLTEMPASNTWIYGVYAPNQYTLTVNYVDGDGNPLDEPYTEDVFFGMPYSVISPEITNYAPDSFSVDEGSGMTGNEVTVSGTMPAGDVTVTVTYRSTEGKLVIYYLFTDGSEAATSYSDDVTEGQAYSVPSPAVTGYTPDTATVSGTMPDNNGKTVYVYYTPNKYTLSFNVNGGETLADRPIYYGMTYADTGDTYDTVDYVALPTPVKVGSEFLGWYHDLEDATAVKNADVHSVADNVTLIAKWKELDYTVTIKLYFKDGSSAGADITRKGHVGEAYDYTPDPIDGYVTPVKQASTFIASDQMKSYTYVGNVYKLTVKYVNVSNGNADLIPAETKDVEFGTKYTYGMNSTVLSTYITSGLMTATPTTYVIEGTMDVIGGKTEYFYFTNTASDVDVTVTFGTFTFDYTKAVWDPETLVYKIPKKEGADNSVTVANSKDSKASVNVTIAYQQQYTLPEGDSLNVYFTETDSVSATRVASPTFDLAPDKTEKRWMWMEGILDNYIGSVDQDSSRVFGKCVVTIAEVDD